LDQDLDLRNLVITHNFVGRALEYLDRKESLVFKKSLYNEVMVSLLRGHSGSFKMGHAAEENLSSPPW
jgi:hypothetical protein